MTITLANPPLKSCTIVSGLISHNTGGSALIRAALVWDGYLAALLEWGLISVADHELLTSLLPHIEDNPVIRIFTGWEGEDEE
jgi:hypothetical protein